MAILKFCIVVASVIVGVVFLAFGLGTVIPVLKYNDFAIWNFPIGLVFLVLAVAVAHYWVIRREDAELSRAELESELEFAIGARAQDLWVEAGRPANRKPDEFRIHKEECYLFKNDKGWVFVYRRDPTANTKEALSFLKDWVTSLIQLETGALAAFGLAAGFKEIFTSTGTSPHSGEAAAAIPVFAKRFASLELLLIIFSGASILVSMFFGLSLLISLPGAAQRLPVSAIARQSDIFAIRNERGYSSLYETAERFRFWFFLGAVLFAMFVLARLSEQFYRIISG